jgi:protein disulfide-isomerase A6
MKPAWDRLGDDYKASDTVMIVDVDCTADGKATCNKMGVKGYPTIKYFSAGEKKGKDYQGGRDYDALKSFVSGTLDKPVCEATTKKNCAKNEVEFLTKMDGKSKAELKQELKDKKKELDSIKSEMKAATKEFNAKTQAWKKRQAVINKANKLLDDLIKAPEAKAEL